MAPIKYQPTPPTACALSRKNSAIDENSPSDRELIRRVREGDEDAAAQLYRRYAARSLAYVQSSLGSALKTTTDPEDIVQSVFKSVFEGMRQGTVDAPEGNTLWGLITAASLNKLREQARKLATQKRDSSRNRSLNDETVLAIQSASLESFESFMRDTLQVLKQGDREILILRIDGYTVDEICDETGRSRRSVERSLQRSRIVLSDLLGED